jgi:hypothetical protein
MCGSFHLKFEPTPSQLIGWEWSKNHMGMGSK